MSDQIPVVRDSHVEGGAMYLTPSANAIGLLACIIGSAVLCFLNPQHRFKLRGIILSLVFFCVIVLVHSMGFANPMSTRGVAFSQWAIPDFCILCVLVWAKGTMRFLWILCLLIAGPILILQFNQIVARVEYSGARIDKTSLVRLQDSLQTVRDDIRRNANLLDRSFPPGPLPPAIYAVVVGDEGPNFLSTSLRRCTTGAAWYTPLTGVFQVQSTYYFVYYPGGSVRNAVDRICLKEKRGDAKNDTADDGRL